MDRGIAIAFGIFFTSVGVIVACIGAYEDWRCETYGDMTRKNTDFVWFDDCYIEHSDEWMRYGDYQKVIIAREGLRAQPREG